MLKWICFIAAGLCVSASPLCAAKSPSPQSMRVVKMVLAEDDAKEVVAAMLAGFQAQMTGLGFPEAPMAIYAEELQRATDSGALASMTAQAFDDNFSASELTELVAFFETPVGRKYLGINKQIGSDPSYFMPVMAQACDSAVRRLEGKDQRMLKRFCDALAEVETLGQSGQK